MVQSLWKSVRQFFKKLKIEFPHDPAGSSSKFKSRFPYDPLILLPEVYPNWTESGVSNRYLYTHVQGSIIHNKPKGESKQVSFEDEWPNKMWYIHTIKWYSVFKKGRGSLHATR